jgi:hypothetical protein
MKKWYLLTTISLVLLSLSLFWVAGCGDDTSSGTPVATATATAMPSGSTNVSPAALDTTVSSCKLLAPAGTFAGAGTLTVTPKNQMKPTLPSGVTQISNVYFFELIGTTLVSGQSVKVTLPTSKAVYSVFQSNNGTNWTLVGSNTTSFDITGFPTYLVLGSDANATPLPTQLAPTTIPTSTPVATATSTTPVPTNTPIATATSTGGGINITVN